MQSDIVRAKIASLGTEIGPESMEAVHALFDKEQRALLEATPASERDLAYGPDPRHRLDIYLPKASRGPAPVVIFLHGGGFRRGDKGDEGRWQNANVGAWAAQEGMIGIPINYRLAPAHRWPAGADDIAAAVAWVRANVASRGGDPNRIVLMGTSAGAVHVAGYLQQYPDSPDICGAVFLSGLYGVTPYDDVRDLSYFGEDAAAHAKMIPLEAVAACKLPLLIACAEHDPTRFQTDFLGLVQRRFARVGRLGHAYIASGHNHFSLPYHLGTSDRRLADEIRAFVGTLRARERHLD